MTPVGGIGEFPWHELPRVERRAASVRRALSRTLETEFDGSTLTPSLEELLGSRIELRHDDPTPAPCPEFSGETVCIQARDRSLAALIEVEADLAAAAISRLLGRPLVGVGADVPLDNALRGALAALVLEVTRRVSRRPVLSVVPTISVELRERLGLLFECSVRLDGHRYGLRAWLVSTPVITRSRSTRERLERLASLKLSIPLVVAAASSSRSDLELLAPGDVWLAGTGFWIDPNLCGRGILLGPLAESGVAVDVSPGQIVLGTACRELAADLETGMDNDNLGERLSQTALEAPLLVRVELGCVTLSAAEWSELGPGDVLDTGRQLGGPVILRVGGQAVAEGELVNLEGQLGVRITSLASAAR